MRKKRPIKNPCSICGRPVDSSGWCGSSNHDAGNPFGGIVCFVGGRIFDPHAEARAKFEQSKLDARNPHYAKAAGLEITKDAEGLRMNKNYKYLEVWRDIDEVCVKRIDVSNLPERQLDKLESGILRNMNHEAYSLELREVHQLLPEVK